MAYLADEKLNASNQAAGYVPRFDPVLGFEPGTETINYVTGDIVTLSAGRFDVDADTFLAGQGNVTQVTFHAVNFADLFSLSPLINNDVDFDTLPPWQLLGAGVFVGSGMWTLDWDTSSFAANEPGWALRVDFQDTTPGVQGGVLRGVNMAGAAVPEPSSFAIFGIGLASFGVYRWRRNSVLRRTHKALTSRGGTARRDDRS